MLIALSERERTRDGFNALLDSAELALRQVLPTGSEFASIDQQQRGRLDQPTHRLNEPRRVVAVYHAVVER